VPELRTVVCTNRRSSTASYAARLTDPSVPGRPNIENRVRRLASDERPASLSGLPRPPYFQNPTVAVIAQARSEPGPPLLPVPQGANRTQARICKTLQGSLRLREAASPPTSARPRLLAQAPQVSTCVVSTCVECGEEFEGRRDRLLCGSRRCKDRRYARLHPEALREKERRKYRRRVRGRLPGEALACGGAARRFVLPCRRPVVFTGDVNR
jgi:hypothetical protein